MCCEKKKINLLPSGVIYSNGQTLSTEKKIYILDCFFLHITDQRKNPFSGC